MSLCFSGRHSCLTNNRWGPEPPGDPRNSCILEVGRRPTERKHFLPPTANHRRSCAGPHELSLEQQFCHILLYRRHWLLRQPALEAGMWNADKHTWLCSALQTCVRQTGLCDVLRWFQEKEGSPCKSRREKYLSSRRTTNSYMGGGS